MTVASRFDDLADQVARIPHVRGLWLVDAAGEVVASRLVTGPPLRMLEELLALVRAASAAGAVGAPVWYAAHAERAQILVRWLDRHALVAAAGLEANLALIRVGITGFNLRANYPSLPPMMMTDLPEMTPTPTPSAGFNLRPSGPKRAPPRAAPTVPPTTPRPAGPEPSARDAPREPVDVERLQRALTDLIGPYASVLVRRERDRLKLGDPPSQQQYEALVDACASHIDNTPDRTRFVARLLGADRRSA